MTTEVRPAKQAKLLIVEDDVMTRVVLADMLCELGYTVAAEAASIEEALEATRKTNFDLAILDADLQGRSVSPVAGPGGAASDQRYYPRAIFSEI